MVWFNIFLNSNYIFKFHFLGALKITAVITDNASNMKSMRNLIKTKYPAIETFGCAAHGLNLLLNDLRKMAYFQKCLDTAKEIVREINGSNLKLAKFDLIREKKCKTLKFYTPIRYCFSCVFNYKLLIIFLFQVVQSFKPCHERSWCKRISRAPCSNESHREHFKSWCNFGEWFR